MIVPYIVVRSNNLPLTALSAVTCSEASERLLDRMSELRRSLSALKDPVCERLYAMAGADRSRYRELIDLKRRIFKDDGPGEVLSRHAALLQDLTQLSDWTDTARELVALGTELTRLFDSEVKRARNHAQALAAHSMFMHGVAFARGQIATAVLNYVSGQRFDDKKALNDEETVYRYLTRAVIKVSPFSTFTSVGFAPVSASGNGHLTRHSGVGHRYSYDRAMILKLFDRFVIRHKSHWRLRLTGNRVAAGGRVHAYLFMDRPDIYPYRTSFAKTALPALTQKLADAPFTWDQLRSLLPADADGDALLDKWITAGVLSYEPRLNEQVGDIVADFRAVAELVAAQSPAAAGTAEILRRIEAAYGRLNLVSARELPELIDSIHTDFRALADQLGLRMIKTAGLVYHDTHLRILGAAGDAAIARIAAQTEEFLTGYISGNFKYDLSEEPLEKLRASIPADRALDVFSFHELAERCLQRKEDRTASAARARLIALFEHVWNRRHEEEILLEPRSLPNQRRRLAFSAYGHVIGDRFVLNNVDTGYLRCLSRFFTFTDDPEVLSACRAAYGPALSQAYEFYDTFGFNTGCRPRLCGSRVWLDATGAASIGDITLADLEVHWPADHRYPSLRNRHNGAPIQLRHTALFILDLYPRILETLLRFASIGEACYFTFRFGLYKRVIDAGEDQVIRMPQVRYRDLILSRRQWWIPKSRLPQRLPVESGAGYLMRLDAWRRDLGMPGRVFVRRHQRDKVLERDISNIKKPLFIDFAAPIMSRMIGRAFNTAFDYLSAEEMLPDDRHDFVGDGQQHYASEIIIEQTCDTHGEQL